MRDLDRLQDEARNLPQEKATWLVVIRQLRTWLEEQGKVIRPWAMLCLTRSAGMIIGNEILAQYPDRQEAAKVLLGFMLDPAPGAGGDPFRPTKIAFEDKALAREVREQFSALEVRTTGADAPQEVDFIIASLEQALRGEDEREVQGLLEAEGVTPDLAGEFFAAAAEFYRAEPWIQLSNSQTLAISFPPDEQPWYVTVMGQGGVEYGLLLQRTWDQVEGIFRELHDPMGGIPSEGWHSVSFEPAYQLPFADLDAIERYGWEVAGEEAYPLPVIFDREQAYRPPGAELSLWEQLMRVVVKFGEHHLQPDGVGDYRPVDVEISVPYRSMEVAARVRYPAGERDRGEQSYRRFQPEVSEDDDVLQAPDRRGLEGMLMDLAGEYADPRLEEAQRVMYAAWDSTDREHRIELAEQALEISPDCADAFVLLAEEDAPNVREALGYYRLGVEAGERALGKDTFEQDSGYFWGLLQTRPYMRARYGLACCLWELDRAEEAEGHFRDLLRLNPSDNQGVRYTLLHLLMETQQHQAGLDLIDDYNDDPSAEIVYNRALLLYRQGGGERAAAAALEDALERNPNLPPYLLGETRVPSALPARMGIGEESEAAAYAATYLNHWRATPGALDWLRAHTGQKG